MTSLRPWSPSWKQWTLITTGRTLMRAANFWLVILIKQKRACLRMFHKGLMMIQRGSEK